MVVQKKKGWARPASRDDGGDETETRAKGVLEFYGLYRYREPIPKVTGRRISSVKNWSEIEFTKNFFICDIVK